MWTRIPTVVRDSVFSYRNSRMSGRGALGIGLLACILTGGCAATMMPAGTSEAGKPAEPAQAVALAGTRPTAEDRALGEYIDYMKRATEANPRTWAAMKGEVEKRMNGDPLKAKLQLGFLLTSPNEVKANVAEGRRVLQEVLDSEPTLDPRLRDLVEIRLIEAGKRAALHKELEEVNGKIDELLSIESSMEEQKGKPEARHE